MSIRDCAFDSTSFNTGSDFLYGNATYNDYDYNAYTNSANPFSTGGGHDVQNATFDWQSGFLGNYYLQSSSLLVDTGSQNADLAGLLYFTTQVDAFSREYGSTVDIGYHYIGIDYAGKPIDWDSDGIPDYLEDANGNGTLDSGETDPYNSSDSGLRVFITRPRSGSNLP